MGCVTSYFSQKGQYDVSEKEQGCDPALKEKDAQDDKRPIKKPTESGEDDKEREDAALKIQTKYRQYQAKKTVQQLKDDRGKSPNAPDESQESESDKPQSPTFDAHDPKLNEAATRIQAGVKGYLTRKELQTIKEEKKAKEADVNSTKTEGVKVIEEAKNIKDHGQSSLLGFQHQITSQLSDLQKQAEATKAELNQQIQAKATQMQESAKLAREQAEAKAAEAKQAAEAKASEAKIAAEAKALELKTAAEDAKKTAEAKAEEAKQTIDSKAEETKQIVEAKVEEAKKSAEQVKQTVEAKVQETKHVIEEKVEETKQTVDAKVQEAKQTKEAKETEIKQAVETTSANVKHSINEVIADSETKIDEIKEATESKVSEIEKSAEATADSIALTSKEVKLAADSKVNEAIQHAEDIKAATENHIDKIEKVVTDDSLKVIQEIENSIDESKANINNMGSEAKLLTQGIKSTVEEKVNELKYNNDMKAEEVKGACESKLEDVCVTIDSKKMDTEQALSDPILNAEIKFNEEKQTAGGIVEDAKQLIHELQQETKLKATEIKGNVDSLKDSANKEITTKHDELESKMSKAGNEIVDVFQQDIQDLKDQVDKTGQITDSLIQDGQVELDSLKTNALPDYNMMEKKVNDVKSKAELIGKKNLNESLKLIDQEMKDFLEYSAHDELVKTKDEVKFDINGEQFDLKSPEVNGKINEKCKKVKSTAQQAVAKSQLTSSDYKDKAAGCFTALSQEMDAEVVEIKKNIKEKKRRNRKTKEKLFNPVESNKESEIVENKNLVSTELLDSYLKLLQEQTESTPNLKRKLDENPFSTNLEQGLDFISDNKAYLDQNWNLDSSVHDVFHKDNATSVCNPAAQTTVSKTINVDNDPTGQEAALIHIELLETEAELLQTEAALFEAEVERAALTDLGAQFDDSPKLQIGESLSHLKEEIVHKQQELTNAGESQVSNLEHQLDSHISNLKQEASHLIETASEESQELRHLMALQKPIDAAKKDFEAELESQLDNLQQTQPVGASREEAATKIQAGFRGFKARQEVKAMVDDINTEAESKVEDVNKAATKIQASFRGYRVRKELNQGDRV